MLPDAEVSKFKQYQGLFPLRTLITLRRHVGGVVLLATVHVEGHEYGFSEIQPRLRPTKPICDQISSYGT